jgi:hypothetical protein
MAEPASLANLADTIRVAVAPVFLLTGVAALLSVMTGRLARIIDRAREFESKPRESLAPDQGAELRLIPARIKLINCSILLSGISAFAVCLVIALLFVSSLIHLHIGIAVALTFIVSMLLLMGALVTFIAEVRLAISLLYVSEDALFVSR